MLKGIIIREYITRTTIATTKCPLLLLLIKAQTALVQGINVFLVCQVTYFKKDGQDLVEVRRQQQ